MFYNANALFFLLPFQCVFEVDKENGLTLTELADGVTVEDVVESTGAEFQLADEVRPMGQI